MRSFKMAIGAVVLLALTGCTLKMGNTEAKLFDGWNQTTTQPAPQPAAPVAGQK